MTLRQYRWGLRVFTCIGLLSLGAFVFGLDPMSLSLSGVVLFFVSLWVVTTGIFSLALLFLYEKAIGDESTAHFIGGALRQGLLLGATFVGIALLLYIHVFAWWNALLVFVFFLLIEFTYRRFVPIV